MCDRRLIRKKFGVRQFRRMTNDLHTIAAIDPLECFISIRRMKLGWTGHDVMFTDSKRPLRPCRAILNYQPKPVRPVALLTDFSIHLNLFAQERSQSIISRTLKLWQLTLTEHNGEHSLKQPQETDEPL